MTVDNQTLLDSADAAYADAQLLADNALIALDAALTEASTAVSGLGLAIWSTFWDPPDVTVTDIVPPILPTNDFSTEVRDAFDYAFNSFNSVLQPQIISYLDTFFPDISECVKTNSDAWLCNTILNGSYVPASVETALWNRARDKEVSTAARAEQEIINAGASRGFSAPSGAVAFTVAAAQEDLARTLTTINRDIAIKAFDTANENTKFAIQQAIALRSAFVSALGDFIKLASAPANDAVDYAKLVLESKTGLYDSAIRLYSAEIEEERLRTSVGLENNSQGLRFYDAASRSTNEYNATILNGAKVQADTALAAAAQLGAIAAAAMTTRNTVVGVSGAV